MAVTNRLPAKEAENSGAERAQRGGVRRDARKASLRAEPLRLEKGMAIIDGPIGTGVDWNEDAVRRFAA